MTDIGVGADGFLYALVNDRDLHYIYEFRSDTVPLGLSWHPTGQYWSRIPGYGLVSDGGYLKNGSGGIVEPRLVVALVNNLLDVVGCDAQGQPLDGAWHLGWFAQPGAPGACPVSC